MSDLLTPEEFITQYSEQMREDLNQYDLQVNKLGFIGFFLNILGNTRYDIGNFYQDLFKEAFPGTATQDYNLYMHSSIYGYSPGFATPSVASGSFTFDFALLPSPSSNIVKREVSFSNIKFKTGNSTFSSTYTFKFVNEGTSYYGIVYDDQGGTTYIPAASSVIEIPFYNVQQVTTETIQIGIPNYNFGSFYPYNLTVSSGYLSDIDVNVRIGGQTYETDEWDTFEVKQAKYLENALSDVVFMKPLGPTRYIFEFGSGIRGNYIPNSSVEFTQYLTNGTNGNLNVPDTPKLQNATTISLQTNNVGDVTTINANVRGLLQISFEYSEGGIDVLSGEDLRTALVSHIQTRDNFISKQDYINISSDYLTDFKVVFRKLGVTDNIVYLYKAFRDKYMIPAPALNWTQQVILDNEYIVDNYYNPVRTTSGEKIYTTGQILFGLTGIGEENTNGNIQSGSYDYYVTITDNFNESVSSETITVDVTPVLSSFDIICNEASTLTGGEYFTFSSPTEDYYVWYEIDVPDRQEVVTINCNAASTLSTVTGDYFLIYSTTGSYYVWYNVDGTTPEPTVLGTTGSFEVIVNASDPADTVAEKTAVIIDPHMAFNAGYLTDRVVITNINTGPVDDASDTNTGFAVTVTQQGVDATTYGSDPSLTGTSIKVTVGDTSTAVAVASATAAQVDLETEFISSNTTMTTSIECVNAGEVTAPTVGSTGFAINNVISGLKPNSVHLGWSPSSIAAKYVIYGRKDSNGNYHRWETHDSEFIDTGDEAMTGILGSRLTIVTNPGDCGFKIELVSGGTAGSETVTFSNHVLTIEIQDGSSTQQNIADALETDDHIDTVTPITPSSTWILTTDDNDTLVFTPDEMYIPPTTVSQRQVTFNPTFQIYDKTFISPFVYVLNDFMGWYDGHILYDNFLANFTTITNQNTGYELPIIYLNLIYDGVNRVTTIYIKSYQDISDFHFDLIIPTVNIDVSSYGTSPEITYIDENTWRYRATQEVTDYGIFWDEITAQIKTYDGTTGTPGTHIFTGETRAFQQIFDVSDQLKVSKYFDVLGHEYIVSIPVIDKELYDSDSNYYLDAMFEFITNNSFDENRMISDDIQFRFLNTYAIEALHLRHLTKQAYDFVLFLPLKLKVTAYLNMTYVNNNSIDITTEKNNLMLALSQLLVSKYTGTSVEFYNSKIVDFVHNDRPYIKRVLVEVKDNNDTIITDGLETYEDDQSVISSVNSDSDEESFDRKLNILRYTSPSFYWDVDNIEIQFLY